MPVASSRGNVFRKRDDATTTRRLVYARRRAWHAGVTLNQLPLADPLDSSQTARGRRGRAHQLQYRTVTNRRPSRVHLLQPRRLALVEQGATDDFTFTGVDGAAWGPGWTFVQGSGDILTNRGRMVTGTGAFDGDSAVYTTGIADAVVSIDVEIPTNDAQFPEVRFRYSDVNFDYIRLVLEPHNDLWYVHDFDNDVQQTLLANGGLTVAANDVVHIKLMGVGTALYLRLWLNADPEPTTWTATFTSSFGTTNTQVMVRTVTSNLGVAITNYWDNFAFATAVTGTVAVTDGADTSSIAGIETFSGTIAVGETADSPSISGTETFSGTIGATEAADTSSISGTADAANTIAATEAADTSVFTGTVTITGTIGATEAADSPSISGTQTFLGTIGATEAADTPSISGSSFVSVTGTIGASEARDTSSINASTFPNPTGTIGAAEARDTSSLVGTLIDNVTGTIGATEARDTGSSTGIIANPVTGTITGTEPLDRSSIAAQRYGKQPVPVRPVGVTPRSTIRRRRYYNPNQNPVTGP